MLAKHRTICALIALLLPVPLLADTLMEFRSHDSEGGDVPGVTAVSVYVSDSFVRINESDSSWMLYDHGADTLFVVDEQRREYTPLNREAIETLAAEMSAARAEVERQIAKMTPEQKAMVEQMVGHSLDQKPAVLKFASSGERKTVNGYSCTVGRLVSEGRTYEEFCTAPPRAIGMPGSEYQAIRSMYALMSELQSASGFSGGVPSYSQLDGLPIEIKSRDGGVQVISRVSHGDIDDRLFRLPEGYQRVLPAGSEGSLPGQTRTLN